MDGRIRLVVGMRRRYFECRSRPDRVERVIRESLQSGNSFPVAAAWELDSIANFVAMRGRIVATLVADVKAAGGTALSYIGMGEPKSTGALFKSLLDVADTFEILAYTSDLEVIQRRVEEANGTSRLTVGLLAYPPGAQSISDLTAAVRTVRDLGVDWISFYNYGIMPYANLAWIKAALAD